MGLKHGQRILADLAGANAGLLTDLPHEHVDQKGNVLAPLGERRHPHRDHRQAMVEILANAPSAIKLSRL